MTKQSEVRSIRIDEESQKRLAVVCAKHNLNPNDLIRLGLTLILPLAEKEPFKIKVMLIDE